MLLLLFAVACGATATATPVPPTATTAPVADTAAPAATEAPSAQPRATTAAAAPTAVPTAAPAVAAPVPDWVSIGQGKHYNGVIPIATCSKPGFWDVHYGGSSCSTLRPSHPRFNQLLEWNPVQTDEIQGDLAESWEISDDGKLYTFRLHDAQWSDGKPVTAADVVFTLDRIVEPGAIRARTAALRRFYESGTAEAIDAKTVRVPTKIRAVTFMLNMASDYMVMYPKHIVEGQSQDDLNCCPKNLIGSGPWIFKDQILGESYEYEKNPNYFKEGRPFFDGFQAFFIKDKARLMSAFKVGQLSMSYAFFSPSVQPKDLEILEQDTQGRIKKWVILDSSRELYMNVNEPPFDNPKLRDGTHPLSLGGTGYPVRDPSETLTQFFQLPSLRNSYDWSHPRIDELSAIQEAEFDPEKRQAMFKEMADILHQGEGHYVPLIWFPLSGALITGYRISM
ncbi:Periplasmic oligopeptide-binding protein [Geodia barretti]|uniref:Periplasmic oligopeptide-binding protein n=1 Tax=Geodia barretti TaxID=519541 RepID=A0AA35XDD8_GEOBA|nr:Periplasmic oligopeptide-binding protein [Geodia barretti]